MAGLRRISKMYGGIIINDKKWVWDYASDEPVPEEEMPRGSVRWQESEAAKYRQLATRRREVLIRRAEHAGVHHE